MVSEGPDRPVIACVLAGGVGTRLYPAARSDRPKQFLPFGGSESLLTRTVRRTGFADATCVVTREGFAERVAEHAPEATVFVEPDAKDTGPAAVYAAARIRAAVADGTLVDRAGSPEAGDGTPAGGGGEPVIVTLPADHHVPDRAAFERAMTRGARVAAETESLVTFGVEPTRPATAYGYVHPGTDHGEYARVASFTEKPDRATAERYVDRGDYWNAGVFAWTPDALFAAARDTPLAETTRLLTDETSETPTDERAARAFAAAPEASVDEAVLERAENVVVVPASFTWDDLGSWDALERIVPSEDGNATDCETVAVDASGNVVAGDHHVSLVGVEGVCVVAVDDRVLVVPKEDAQRVREVVERLRAEDAF